MIEKETKKNIIYCHKCNTRMVKQSEIFSFLKFSREPSGRVCFSLTDDIPVTLYVCPKCHLIELYYDAAARY